MIGYQTRNAGFQEMDGGDAVASAHGHAFSAHLAEPLDIGRHALGDGGLGVKFRNCLALLTSAEVRGTSPGCSESWLMTAFLPMASSMVVMRSLSVTVCEPPRLKMSHTGPVR